MNAQEIFDAVVAYLRDRGFRVRGNVRQALYRGPEGGVPATPGTMAWVHGLAHVAAHEDLVAALQAVHDGYLVEDWEDEFQRVAEAYGVVYTPEPPADVK